MIITENVNIDGQDLIYRHSDSNRYIVRNNINYEEAYDLITSNYIYVEGDIIQKQQQQQKSYAEAGKILMGIQE